MAAIARTTLLFGLGFVPLDGHWRPGAGRRGQQRTRVVHRPAGRVLPAGGDQPGRVDLVWRLMLAPDGPVNGSCSWLGQAPVRVAARSEPRTWRLILVQFLKIAGLQHGAVPGRAADGAARSAGRGAVDGATRWQSFRAITLPLIAPFTLMVTILLTIASFKTFALIQLMTRGGPGQATTVLSYYIYQTGLAVVRHGLRQRDRRRPVRRGPDPDRAAAGRSPVVGL